MFATSPGILFNAREAVQFNLPVYVVYAMNQVWLGAIKGFGKTIWPMICTLLCYALFRVAWCLMLIPVFNSMHIVYLSLGTNLGYRRRNIRRAIEKIGEQIGAVVRQSALYVSEPWGFESENNFVNAVVRCETALSPHKLLRATQRIERQMGRKQKSLDGVYHDRIIDIDILLYDDLTIDTPTLKIPHPLMQQRDFVMIPLGEIQD